MTKTEFAEQIRQIEEGEAALKDARAELRRIQRTLNKSRRVRKEALPKLQKAGRVR